MKIAPFEMRRLPKTPSDTSIKQHDRKPKNEVLNEMVSWLPIKLRAASSRPLVNPGHPRGMNIARIGVFGLFALPNSCCSSESELGPTIASATKCTPEVQPRRCTLPLPPPRPRPLTGLSSQGSNHSFRTMGPSRNARMPIVVGIGPVGVTFLRLFQLLAMQRKFASQTCQR